MIGSISSSQRKLHIELLRIIACFFVIFNHTGSNGFYLFATVSSNTFRYWIYLFFSIGCKFAVPLFFMISGALLLSREESFKTILKKRVLRMVVVLLVFSVLYYVFKCRGSLSSLSVKDFLSRLYSGEISGAYWFLYAYIGFLLTIPFLRSLVKNLEKKYFYYLFGLAFFLDTVLPLAEYVLFRNSLTLNSWIKMTWLISMAVINPIVGYYIENRLDVSKPGKLSIYMWIASVAGLIITCAVTRLYANELGEISEATFQPFHYCFATFIAATMYISVKSAFEGRKNQPKPLEVKVLTFLGGAVFGTYLIHMFFMDMLHYRIIPVLTGAGIDPMVAGLIFTFIIMILGMIAARIMKLIPGVKKFL